MAHGKFRHEVIAHATLDDIRYYIAVRNIDHNKEQRERQRAKQQQALKTRPKGT